jgi:hypothetical protein
MGAVYAPFLKGSGRDRPSDLYVLMYSHKHGCFFSDECMLYWKGNYIHIIPQGVDENKMRTGYTYTPFLVDNPR